MKIFSVKVADWPDFIRRHNIILLCDCPDHACSACRGKGFVWPTAATAFDSGYEAEGDFPRVPYTDTVAFEYERHIWLAYAGEGEDHTPALAMAWINLFPRCQWLPEQFGDVNSLPDYERLLPPEDVDKLVVRLERSMELDQTRSQSGLEALRQYRERRQQ